MKKHVYDIFAERWIRNGSIWIISDPHFGDVEAYCFRNKVNLYNGEYSDIEIQEKVKENDLSLVKKINSRVNKNDTLIILGDIGDTEYVKKLRGYKVLIMGNHDKGASNYKELFDEVYEGPLMISDRIILSHEPIIGLPEYIFNIHGHDHSGTYRTERSFNVCAEYISYTPISLNELINVKCILRDVDNIHRFTIDKRNQ